MEKTIELKVTPPTEAMMLTAQEHLYKAQQVIVSTAAESMGAQHLRAAIAAKIKELTDQRLTITRKMDASKKDIMDLFRGPIEMLETAKFAIDSQLVTFEARQQQERRRAQDEANATAEAQRQRLLERAEKAAVNGKGEKARALEDEAAMVVAPVVPVEAPRAAGTSIRNVWKFHVTDGSKINPAFLMPDEVKIGQVVRSMGRDAEGVVGEGLHVYPEQIVTSRS